MKNKDNEWPSGQRLKKADGTIAYIWDNKFHNWEGPALIPGGNEKKREYYLYGIKYSESEFKEVVRNRTGLPWYKQPTPKGTTHRN